GVDAAELPLFEAARIVAALAAEVPQNIGDGRRIDAEGVGEQGAAGDVGNVVARLAVRGQRHRCDRAEVDATPATTEPQAIRLHATGRAATLAMRLQELVIVVE